MPETASRKRLLLVIARHQDALDELLTGLLDAGVTGATVLESKGMGQLLREDMPIFAGLAGLLPQSTGNRLVVSLTTVDVIENLKLYVREMKEEDRPIAIVMKVNEVFGLPALADDQEEQGDTPAPADSEQEEV